MEVKIRRYKVDNSWIQFKEGLGFWFETMLLCLCGSFEINVTCMRETCAYFSICFVFKFFDIGL
jgi:hypothetical protein